MSFLYSINNNNNNNNNNSNNNNDDDDDSAYSSTFRASVHLPTDTGESSWYKGVLCLVCWVCWLFRLCICFINSHKNRNKKGKLLQKNEELQMKDTSKLKEHTDT